MQPFRLVVLGGIGFAVVSMLLPFASFPIVGVVDGIAADAWPALIPLTVVVVAMLVGPPDVSLSPTAGVVSVLGSSAALVFSLVKVADAIVAARETAGATVGPGSFVLSAAAVVATGGATVGALVRR